MSKAKILFRIMSLILFLGCLVSCEKETDEIIRLPEISTEVSKTPIPQLDSTDSSPNFQKVPNDQYAQWDSKTKRPRTSIRRNGNTFSRFNHPNYQELIDEVFDKEEDFRRCDRRFDENEEECDEERNEFRDAQDDLEEYEISGLPQGLNCIFIREDDNFVYTKDASENTEIAFPLYNPGVAADAWILRNGQFKVWRKFIYLECATDNVDPTINCNIRTQTLSAGSSLPDLTNFVTATDNCSLSSLIQSPATGSTVSEGNQTITFTAKDIKDNTSSCTITVIGECRNNGIFPKMGCGLGTQNVNEGTRLRDYRSDFSAMDQCGKRLNLSQSPNPGSIVRRGSQNVTVKATDRFGLSSSCTFTVQGRCTPPNVKLNLNNFCFLSRHTVHASGNRADQYEWKVFGNGNIGKVAPNGQIAIVNFGGLVRTNTNNIDIYTGTGVLNFNGTHAITPKTSDITVWVRGKNNNCNQWSNWRIVTKKTVQNCLQN